jgi:hypothetical protein
LLKAKTGTADTYVDTVDRVLETYASAAHATYHDAQFSNQPPAQMKAEILRRYQELGEQQDGPAGGEFWARSCLSNLPSHSHYYLLLPCLSAYPTSSPY